MAVRMQSFCFLASEERVSGRHRPSQILIGRQKNSEAIKNLTAEVVVA